MSQYLSIKLIKRKYITEFKNKIKAIEEKAEAENKGFYYYDDEYSEAFKLLDNGADIFSWNYCTLFDIIKDQLGNIYENPCEFTENDINECINTLSKQLSSDKAMLENYKKYGENPEYIDADYKKELDYINAQIENNKDLNYSATLEQIRNDIIARHAEHDEYDYERQVYDELVDECDRNEAHLWFLKTLLIILDAQYNYNKDKEEDVILACYIS